MHVFTKFARTIRRVAIGPSRKSTREHHCIIAVRDALELGGACADISRHGRAGFQRTLRQMRELYELATPAIYLQVETGGEACRIVLMPWDRRQVSFIGRGWHLLAGAEATEGIEAFIVAKAMRTPLLYSHAPDHPLFVVAIRQPGEKEIRGYFPPYVTHVTIVGNGHVVADACRLPHDEGARVFHVRRAA